MLKNFLLSSVFVFSCIVQVYAQSKHWQKNTRNLHYTEDNGDFLLVNGKYRFNKALYGNNLGSRVEAGDLPEFALYMPGMGGNLQFVIQGKAGSKKLKDADNIETRLQSGRMSYTIKDAILGTGSIELQVLAHYDKEGMIVKVQSQNIPNGVKFFAAFGGASGSTFSRAGDIGADPESNFYLKPEYCVNNNYSITKNSFELQYLNRKKTEEFLYGVFSETPEIFKADAKVLQDESKLLEAKTTKSPIVFASYSLNTKPIYISISRGKSNSILGESALATQFKNAESGRLAIANRIQLKTPDRFINTFGSTLALAADAVWESPTFLHGAVAWRMRLNAWRGAYAADALGWHDRAKEHFSSYSNSQVLAPTSAKVVMDTALNLARHIEELGTSMFSSGYISRNPNNNTVAHHYDMNLVFFDQIFTHFDYTGDKAYIEKLWPTIERHMDWERRNFKRNGLYDAYCAIWASDGLQYSGGGVAHTTAYNYRANIATAKLAKIIGKDPSIYEKEAKDILLAMKSKLWLSDRGYFAEFQDMLGKQLVHDKPGLWTIYHVADAFMLDDFESYQNTQYINNHLPKIPINVHGQQHDNLYTLATSNWQPYTWSVNNVTLGENLQAALAYWQSGRKEDAYQLWKSNIIESMYHGISPGNFHQLSHYDAFRGELYRDFADPIGVASRTLTEGLFGYLPKLLEGYVSIKPGFPSEWNFAELNTPHWSYHFKNENNTLKYHIKTKYNTPVALHLEVPVYKTSIKKVLVNGKEVAWTIKEQSIGNPVLLFKTDKYQDFQISIELAGSVIKFDQNVIKHAYSDDLNISLPAGFSLNEVFDPQKIIKNYKGNKFSFIGKEHKGTFFVKGTKDNVFSWFPINVHLVNPIVFNYTLSNGNVEMTLHNTSNLSKSVKINNRYFSLNKILPAGAKEMVIIPSNKLTKGTNNFTLEADEYISSVSISNWDLKTEGEFSTVDLSTYYNDRVSNIFQQKYESPRPVVPTLQLPTQGIGNWCYPLTTANIDDTGLMANRKNDQLSYLDIPFSIKGNTKNIVFTSQWDNYPTEVTVKLTGKAKKAYLMVAGSTNPMQSQMTNAKIIVNYQDGSKDLLELKNPSNWWPIEQDFLDDNYAFEIPDDQIPYRIKLKSGELYKGGSLQKYDDIKGYSSRAIDGGAATLLDLPLDNSKTLKSLQMITETNDVVVGLMALTLLK
ncbi:DUF4450 domain-containing protein [Sphingobacterium bovistauri]|uniref:DUF4450 domain-containing protein n=1 Tax=Sphingobacterium bovistauri TaxID=2781959 RepID=A0ABS7Z107_9SPHI|nr:DUF4450 domain-containing protein [Sphingobacterium bovistauri]MCA5003859.1 DUF4450 domain-containing protein [Sphingobacterium bovistauri]